MMKKYRVMLEGRNFLIEMDGKVGKFGFYQTFLLEAGSATEAESAAVQKVKDSPDLKTGVQNSKDDPPTIHLEEIEEIQEFPKDTRPVTGRGWYSEDAENTSNQASDRELVTHKLSQLRPISAGELANSDVTGRHLPQRTRNPGREEAFCLSVPVPARRGGIRARCGQTSGRSEADEAGRRGAKSLQEDAKLLQAADPRLILIRLGRDRAGQAPLLEVDRGAGAGDDVTDEELGADHEAIHSQ